MNTQNQKKLGKAVREQGGLTPSNGKMTDLVFDPVTGDFVVKDKDAELNEGEMVVTEMTNNGFAAKVGQMTPERFEAEKRILGQFLPQNAYLFQDDLLLLAAKTNSGNIYTIWIELKDFPNKPEAGVTKMLKDKDGNNLSYCSSDMHTLTTRHGGTTICHYGNSWTPMVSLFKVYVKCRLWLEMYELHLETGKTIDYYLKHDNHDES